MYLLCVWEQRRTRYVGKCQGCLLDPCLHCALRIIRTTKLVPLVLFFYISKLCIWIELRLVREEKQFTMTLKEFIRRRNGVRAGKGRGSIIFFLKRGLVCLCNRECRTIKWYWCYSCFFPCHIYLFFLLGGPPWQSEEATSSIGLEMGNQMIAAKINLSLQIQFEISDVI